VSLSDELEKLEGLHQRGVLTQEEFARAKARLLDGVPGLGASAAPSLAAVNSLRRSRTDRWIGGVCGGMGRATGVEAWVWRVGFVLLGLWGGTGLLIYLLMWIFVPSD
jgi:phage shock protein C